VGAITGSDPDHDQNTDPVTPSGQFLREVASGDAGITLSSVARSLSTIFTWKKMVYRSS
jgi:hypothetical protein